MFVAGPPPNDTLSRFHFRFSISAIRLSHSYWLPAPGAEVSLRPQMTVRFGVLGEVETVYQAFPSGPRTMLFNGSSDSKTRQKGMAG